MLRGKATVFLSCSEKFKKQVAFPIRQALDDIGMFAVIVSEEPMLPQTDPDSKVESYLNASDAFVALCTPDDQAQDGSIQCRQNIVDEIQRASQKPHLRARIQVFREPTVRLPSNINPIYEELDVGNVVPVTELIVRQLASWEALAGASERATVGSTKAPDVVVDLITGLTIGDHEEAARRAYRMVTTQSRVSQEIAVSQLRRFVRDGGENDDVLMAMSILEAINQLDLSLIGTEIIEEFANSENFSQRSLAAVLLWDRATVEPGTVPLGLLGRLARPGSEDWYVHAPAMAATKQLLLRRREARIIFDGLAASSDAEDRYAVATALLDVARVDKWAVPRDLTDRLARDGDDLVAGKGQEVLRAIADRVQEPASVQTSIFISPSLKRLFMSSLVAGHHSRPSHHSPP